jgi:hypothetical protein
MANSNAAVVIAIDNDAMAKKQAPEDRRQALRMVEAILFASAEPQSADDLAAREERLLIDPLRRLNGRLLKSGACGRIRVDADRGCSWVQA